MIFSRILPVLAPGIRCCRQAKLLFAAVLMMSAALPGLAQLSGSVYTTDVTGTTVQGNLFTNKTDVYLNGGPQNQTAGSGLPDGTYYFQVTDPSGAILLSADDISCRSVQVTGGSFAGIPSGAPACSHPVSTSDPSIVQLCPTASGRPDSNSAGSRYDPNNWCDTTGNPGGVYKVWVTPTSAYVGPTGSCPTGRNVQGFCDSSVKTKTFKVRASSGTPVAYLTVCKFNDANGDGIQDNGEQPIAGWPITAIGVDMESGPIGPVTEQTDRSGCVTFSVSDFSTIGTATGGVVSVFEGSMTGWQQTAPAVGSYSVDDGNGGTISVNAVNGVPPGASSSSNYYQSFTLVANDNVTLPSFGNTCTSTSCGGLLVTKTASPLFTRTYKWTLSKSVDSPIGPNKLPTVYSTNGGTSSAANYTVTATPDAGTDSNWQATGEITVSNSTLVDLVGVQVTDAVDNGGACTVSYPTGSDGNPVTSITIPAAMDMGHPTNITLQYTCLYTSATSTPAKGTNTASVVSQDQVTLGQGTATVDFSKTAADAITIVDGSINVSDTLEANPPTTTSLGTSSISIDTDGTTRITNPTYTYSHTFTDTAGTCTSHNNTASFVASDNSAVTGSSNTVTVQDCQGKDLSVSKTANTSFTRTYTWNISKTASPLQSETAATSATFNYSVQAYETGYSDGNYAVSGTITVKNPNDWESVPVTTPTDSLGSGCTISLNAGSSATVPASGSSTWSYSCVVPSPTSGTNTATATWNGGAAYTLHSTAPGSALYDFTNPTITPVNASITSTDSLNGGSAVNLCTLTTTATPCTLMAINTQPYTSQTYTYARTVANAGPGLCLAYSNVATALPGVTGTATVNACNTRTGALTMGFWKNPNGQGIITNYCAGVKTASPQISLMTYLAGLAIQPIPPVPNEVGFNPFKDDTKTKCSDEASYVSSIISGATCSTSGTCNAMLRAQMLATALDVYFSDPALGGNQIGAYTGLSLNQPVLGNVVINLSAIHPCTDGSGGATCSGSEDTRPEFGIDPVAFPTCLGTTVSQMLGYSNYNSARNGDSKNGHLVAVSPSAKVDPGYWYNQTKAYQVLAKDSFDDFNNQIAPIAPSGCSPSTTY